MSSELSFELYEVINKHFKNDTDAKKLVTQFEAVIEKIEQKKDVFLTKDD